MRAAQLLLLILAMGNAQAHKPSDSYLGLRVDGNVVTGQWDIALRDLEHAIGIDENDDGTIDWGELRDRYPYWNVYVLSHLQLAGDQEVCSLASSDLLVDDHSDGKYAVLRFVARCSTSPRSLQITYRLFFDLDPQHRGLLRLEHRRQTRTAVFAPTSSTLIVNLAQTQDRWQPFADYVREGIWHIWIGYDHILFLLSLLLPAVLIRHENGWRTATTRGTTFLDVAKIVTAFTFAHSITLSLAILGYLQLPSRWVESAIAFSVILAAGNNLYPLWYRYRAAVAFGFGLVHGLGFAGVLADLSLPRDLLVTALLGFNAGVELGQLAIVGAFLPVALYVSRSRLYVPLALKAGSVGIVVVASLWLAERSLDIRLLAF